MSTLAYSDTMPSSENIDQASTRVSEAQGRLIVTDGLHRGAEYPCTPHQMIVIGAAEDSDLILADGEIARHHCLVAWSGDEYLVRALDAEVETGTQKLRAGEQIRVKPGTSLSFSGVSLLLSQFKEKTGSNKGAKKIAAWFVLAFITLLLLAVGVIFWTPSIAAVNPKPEIKPLPEVQVPVIDERVDLADQVSEIFRLSGVAVAAKNRDKSTVEVTGHFDDMKRIKALIQSRAMMEIKGLKQVVVSNHQQQGEKEAVYDDGKEIARVVMGSDPYAVTRDNTRYYLGAELEDGKTINQIVAEGVLLLSASGQEIFVTSGQLLN